MVGWCLPDNTEHVDVGVVRGEVNEEDPGPSVQPQVVHQLSKYGTALLLGATQVLVVTSPTVCCQQAPVRGAFDLLLRVVGPTGKGRRRASVGQNQTNT